MDHAQEAAVARGSLTEPSQAAIGQEDQPRNLTENLRSRPSIREDEILEAVPAASHDTSSANAGTEAPPGSVQPLEIEGDQHREEPIYPTGYKFVIITAAYCLVLVIAGLDNSIVATAVPSITNEFRSITDIGWYSSAYRLTSCSFQFMFGKMYTVFSIKHVFLTAIGLFEIGSLVSATAQSSSAFVVGRAIAGFGSAGIISGCFTLITHTVPLRKRSIYGGLAGSLETVAMIAAPVLGGVLTESLSWRWCFWINLPLGATTMLLVGFFFQNPLKSRDQSLPLVGKIRKLDLFSTAIFVPSMTCLLLALQWAGSKYGWANARIIVLLLVFAISAGFFIWLQFRRGDAATLPPRIICQRSILAGMWFVFCNNSALAVVDYYMPIYFQSVKEVSASKSGVLVLPIVVGLLITISLSGPAISLVGFYTPFMLATCLLMPIGAGLMTTFNVNANLATLISFQALLGLGAGLGLQAPQVAAQTVLPLEDVPMGISAVMFAQGFGPALVVPLAQTIFTDRLTADLNQFAPGLNATALETMGLADIKAHVGAANLEGALLGYDEAVTQTLYLPVGLSCVMVVGALGMEWKSVKEKRS